MLDVLRAVDDGAGLGASAGRTANGAGCNGRSSTDEMAVRVSTSGGAVAGVILIDGALGRLDGVAAGRRVGDICTNWSYASYWYCCPCCCRGG